jgi:uncharacterized protein YndB with AHSA1/START domain
MSVWQRQSNAGDRVRPLADVEDSHRVFDGGTTQEVSIMNEIIVSAEGVVAAPAEQVYSYLADYRQHHPRFLPSSFSDFQIEAGGEGTGTVVSYRLKAGGRTQAFRATITEPVPGQVMQEHLADGKTVTTFTVSPHPEGSTVQIESRWPSPRGIRGWMERTFAPRMLTPVFTEELRLLDGYARARAEGAKVHV